MPSNDPRLLLAALAKLENLRDTQPRKKQRQFRRWVVRGDAELQPADDLVDRSLLPIQLRDVGWGGMGFVCYKTLPINSIWRCEFLNRGYMIGQQTMVIRHCRKVSEDLYLLGGQFCVEAGLLYLLGLNPGAIREIECAETANDRFLAPSDVN